MQTVIETMPYLAAANAAGMSEYERESVVLFLAGNPEAGDIIKASGGCRKIRIAKPGRGKSAGYRIITWFGGRDIPVFLLTRISHTKQAHRGGESAKVVLRQRLLPDPRNHPDADRV